MSVTHSRELDSASSKRATFSVGSRLLPSGCGGRNPAACVPRGGDPEGDRDGRSRRARDGRPGRDRYVRFRRYRLEGGLRMASMRRLRRRERLRGLSTRGIPLRRPRSRRDRLYESWGATRPRTWKRTPSSAPTSARRLATSTAWSRALSVRTSWRCWPSRPKSPAALSQVRQGRASRRRSPATSCARAISTTNHPGNHRGTRRMPPWKAIRSWRR